MLKVEGATSEHDITLYVSYYKTNSSSVHIKAITNITLFQSV